MICTMCQYHKFDNGYLICKRRVYSELKHGGFVAECKHDIILEDMFRAIPMVDHKLLTQAQQDLKRQGQSIKDLSDVIKKLNGRLEWIELKMEK